MTSQHASIEAAARELVDRYGGRGALDIAMRRVAQAEAEGMGPAHTAALLLLNAVERLSAALP